MSKTKWVAAAVVLFAALSVSAPALAQTDYVGANPPQVGVSDVGSSRGVSVLGGSGTNAIAQQVGGAQGATSGGGGLFAFTGADVLAFLFLAALLTGTGFIIVRKTRAAR